MLREGGMIVYSTCTFSKAEDEEIIQYALSLDDSLKVIPLKNCEGFYQNEFGTKLFPHRIHGEGHFVSLLVKEGNKREHSKRIQNIALIVKIFMRNFLIINIKKSKKKLM